MNKNKILIILSILTVSLILMVGCFSEEELNQSEEKSSVEEIDETVSSDEESIVYPKFEDERPNPIFYEVKGGKNKVYLLGSIHVGYEDMYPLNESIEEAFNKSDIIGFEIDLYNVNEMDLANEMMSYGVYNDGRKMRDIVPEPIFNEVLEHTRRLFIGEEVLDSFKPWFANMLLGNIALLDTGISEEWGVESYFLNKIEDREVIGLEEVKDQMNTFEALSDESQLLQIQETLEHMDSTEESILWMIEHWAEGNIEVFEEMRREMVEEAETESLREYGLRMGDYRDKNMTKNIVELLESDEENTYFLIVGTMHLVGENSIVYNLEELGYELILND